jgi:hypothetical protein
MRILSLALSLAAALAFGTNLGAQSDDHIDDGPSWTAGGHYTAELDLSRQTLTLLPLEGADQVITRASMNTPTAMVPGVYVLDGGALISTHPQGMALDVQESRTLTSELTSDTNAVRLSNEALLARNNGNVGAIYIH